MHTSVPVTKHNQTTACVNTENPSGGKITSTQTDSGNRGVARVSRAATRTVRRSESASPYARRLDESQSRDRYSTVTINRHNVTRDPSSGRN